MEVLAEFLKEKGKIGVTIVNQDSLPENFAIFDAVIGYIHRDLEEKTELKIIEYTQKGGRYICLHHSISSGKAKNKYYFDFLGIRLDNPENSRNPVEPGGGYGWRHDGEKGVTLTLVNLNPEHYITNHKIQWGKPVIYTPSDFPSVEGMYPSILFEKSEVYLNHKFTDGRQKIVLCGMKFYDDRNGCLFMQDRAVWIKRQGKGEIIYFMPGHSVLDFKNQNFAQMILNAIEWEK